MVTDLEANLTYSTQIVLDKTVERRKAEGRSVVGERTNSTGEQVFIVLATEDELLQKQQALVSKAIRTAALRLLPGDIVDEAEDAIKTTLRDRAAKDPDAEKKRIVDSFDEIGVGPKDLAVYLGHPLDRIQPAEMADLRQVYRAIKDGEATWEGVLESLQTTGSAELQEQVMREMLAALQHSANSQTAPPEPKLRFGQPKAVKP